MCVCAFVFASLVFTQVPNENFYRIVIFYVSCVVGIDRGDLEAEVIWRDGWCLGAHRIGVWDLWQSGWFVR